tara:strand:- start:3273 stop:3539 length:267 start_codon:yes stop_codon:yes gene_type:complete
MQRDTLGTTGTALEREAAMIENLQRQLSEARKEKAALEHRVKELAESSERVEIELRKLESAFKVFIEAIEISGLRAIADGTKGMRRGE